jgi:hypothetical protein
MLGATVVCWDIRGDTNEETALIADALGFGVGRASAYTCDITDRDLVSQTVFVNYDINQYFHVSSISLVLPFRE